MNFPEEQLKKRGSHQLEENKVVWDGKKVRGNFTEFKKDIPYEDYVVHYNNRKNMSIGDENLKKLEALKHHMDHDNNIHPTEEVDISTILKGKKHPDGFKKIAEDVEFFEENSTFKTIPTKTNLLLDINNLTKDAVQFSQNISYAQVDKKKQYNEIEQKLSFARDKVKNAKHELEIAEIGLNNAQPHNLSVKQQVVIDARRTLEKEKNNLKKVIYETRIAGHKKHLDEKTDQIFERNEEQLQAEKNLEDAKKAFAEKKTTRTVGIPFTNIRRDIAIGKGAKEVKANLAEANSNYNKLFADNQEDLTLEKNKTLLKKEAITILERRIANLKTEMFKEETKNANIFEKSSKYLGLCRDKWQTWYAKPENKKEFKRRFLFSVGVAGLTGGVGGIAYGLGRFTGSYIGGESFRAIYNRYKTDYRQKLADKRPEHLDILDKYNSPIKDLELNITNYTEKNKEELARGVQENIDELEKLHKNLTNLKETRESYKEKMLLESGETVDKQNKWTKRWDRIGRIAGGVGVKVGETWGIDTEFNDLKPAQVSDVAPEPQFNDSHIPEQPVTTDVEYSPEIKEPNAVDIVEDIPEQSLEKSIGVMADKDIRILRGIPQFAQGHSVAPTQVVELLGSPPYNMPYNKDLIDATGLELMQDNWADASISNDQIFRDPATGTTYNWQEFYEKVDLNKLKKSYLEVMEKSVNLDSISDVVVGSPETLSAQDIIERGIPLGNDNVDTSGITLENQGSVNITTRSTTDSSNIDMKPVDTEMSADEIIKQGIPLGSPDENSVIDLEIDPSGIDFGSADSDMLENSEQENIDMLDSNIPNPDELGPNFETANDFENNNSESSINNTESAIDENILDSSGTDMDTIHSQENLENSTDTLDQGNINSVSENIITEPTIQDIENIDLENENPQTNTENINSEIETASENTFVPEKYFGLKGPEFFSEHAQQAIENTDYDEFVLNDLVDNTFDNIKEYFNGVRLIRFDDGTYGMSQKINLSDVNFSETQAFEKAQKLLGDMGIDADSIKNIDPDFPGEIDIFTPISGDQLVFIQNQIINYKI